MTTPPPLQILYQQEPRLSPEDFVDLPSPLDFGRTPSGR